MTGPLSAARASRGGAGVRRAASSVARNTKRESMRAILLDPPPRVKATQKIGDVGRVWRSIAPDFGGERGPAKIPRRRALRTGGAAHAPAFKTLRRSSAFAASDRGAEVEQDRRALLEAQRPVRETPLGVRGVEGYLGVRGRGRNACRAANGRAPENPRFKGHAGAREQPPGRDPRWDGPD